MKNYQRRLCEELETCIENGEKPVVFLEAGHFDPRLGPDTFSLESLKEATVFGEQIIKAFGSQVKIVFGILVDDLGLECGKEGCSISDPNIPTSVSPNERLPDPIEEILESARFVKRERVLIFSERTTKNRAIDSLRKLMKSESSRVSINKNDATNRFSFEHSSGESVLLAEQEGSIFRAKCPSIMGQHYQDCLSKIRQRFTQMTRLIVVDWSEMMDYSKVTSGSEAAYSVFIAPEDSPMIDIMNIFYIDDLGNDSSYEYTESADICSNLSSHSIEVAL